MLLLIDNYDSFTYNLVQLLGTVSPGLDVRVFRNDKISLDQITQLAPTHIVISPGPCTPNEGGISNDVIRTFAPQIPTLGVCLGHQCIGHISGARIVRADKPMHGKTDRIHHDGKSIYRDVPNPFTATRYHSLVIDPDSLDRTQFDVSAWNADNQIMGIRHKSWPLEGVQFHPESFLTEHGDVLIRNFLNRAS
jgi:anthranilate synthase/aminodeoxychorismate synthase-like glutamine amidotransferase